MEVNIFAAPPKVWADCPQVDIPVSGQFFAADGLSQHRPIGLKQGVEDIQRIHLYLSGQQQIEIGFGFQRHYRWANWITEDIIDDSFNLADKPLPGR